MNYSQVVEPVLRGARQATKFVSPKLVVKATYRGRRDKRSQHDELVVTIGRPNYAERQFIKQCVAAKEPFPVKKLRVR